jgi:hypothetical protein
MFAIGTSRGAVMLFDFTQKFIARLWEENFGSYPILTVQFSYHLVKDYGPVTAIALSSDRERLLCGFARGSMNLWDLTTRTVLKTMKATKYARDIGTRDRYHHSIDSSIMQVAFLTPSEMLSCDNRVGLFIFSFHFRFLADLTFSSYM